MPSSVWEQPITPANPQLNAQGHLYSSQYNDIYFNPEQAQAESRYVYLQSCQVIERVQQSTREQPHVICEIGFGSGLNFLLTWQQWLADNIQPPLHYIGIDKHPLPVAILKKLYQTWQNLTPLAQNLLDQ